MTGKLIKAVARYWRTARKVNFDECDKQEVYELLGYAEQIIRQLETELLMVAAMQGEAVG